MHSKLFGLFALIGVVTVITYTWFLKNTPVIESGFHSLCLIAWFATVVLTIASGLLFICFGGQSKTTRAISRDDE